MAVTLSSTLPTELAFHARISTADVSRIESGRLIPYPGQADRLARILNLNPDELLYKVAGS